MWKMTDIRNTTHFDSSLFKAGLHGGLDDNRGGPILKKVLKVIQIKQPAMIVLENVVGLLHSHKPILDMVMAELQRFGYTAQVWHMNAKDNGIPQNRVRLFIVGVYNNSNSDILLQAPGPLKPTKLSSLLNPITPEEKKNVKFSTHGITEGPRIKQILKDKMSSITKAGFDWQKKCFCIDVDGSAGTMMYETSPCITRARGATGHWLSPRRH
jgi:site-specific DNA-cytosine methylase